jgi:undecaprenyl-diphosphatase
VPLTGLDLAIFQAINGLAGHIAIADQFVFFSSISLLMKSVPYAALLCLIWFRPQATEDDRKIVLAILIAVVVALVINRGLSSALPFRLRPMVTPDIGFRPPILNFQEQHVTDDWSSFPSDHAALFFTLCTGFWFWSRKLGAALTLFSTWIVFQRIYLGEHFPSDVTVGALIGIGSALLVCREKVRNVLTTPLMYWVHQFPTLASLVFFVSVFELGTMFQEIRQIAVGGAVLLAGL